MVVDRSEWPSAFCTSRIFPAGVARQEETICKVHQDPTHAKTRLTQKKAPAPAEGRRSRVVAWDSNADVHDNLRMRFLQLMLLVGELSAGEKY